MNIIILTSSRRQQGGVERFSFYLQHCLERNGHVVTLLGREDLTKTEKKFLKLKKFFGMEQPALGYFLGRKAIQIDFNVCITNGALGWNIKNKKIINVQHGTFARSADRIDRGRNFFKYVMKKYIWGFFERLAGERATKCVAVSQEVRESVEYYYGIKDVTIIPNATDTNFFKPMDRVMCREKMKLSLDKKIAIFVGRFEYAKGKKILEGIQNYLSENNGELIIAKNYSQEELLLLYNASDVFLLPSLQEGCAYALLDAMSCKLPFLASPVGLVSDFKESGIFSECVVLDQTLDSYIQEIQKLFSLERGSKNVLTQSIREYILSKHSLDSFEKSYQKLIQELYD